MTPANTATRHGKPGKRRSENFAVRRWLAAGAASVGMGAALLGLSMVDGQVGVAAADTSNQSSVSASSVGSDDSASTESGKTADSKTDAAEEDSDSEDEADVESDAEAGDVDDIDEQSEESDIDEPADSSAASENDAEPDDAADSAPASKRTAARAEAAPEEAETAEPEAVSEDTVSLAAPAGTSTTLEDLADRKQEDVAKAITALMAATQAWIAALPVDTRVKDDLTTTVNFLRNTFFNQDPTIDPVQIGGQLEGPVTGKINVVDPEGDQVKLRLSRLPSKGTVQLNQDGTYIYTPTAGFNGVDTFAVTADDAGSHVNVLDLFGRPGSRTGVLVNQGAIKFAFTYEGDVPWTDAAKTAVQTGADRLASYFMVAKPVVLTYKMTGAKTGFAAASSDNVSGGPGFHRTVVQNKIITGIDSNGDDFDGEIDFNLTSNWSFDWTVPPSKSDFTGTVMHEMLHTFGFDASVKAKGSNTGTNWTIFDSFIVTADRVRPISRRYVWNTTFDPNLTGGNGGLFFGGPEAVKANGGNPIPLYTPDEWEGGSSVTHLDDDTYEGVNAKMMNAYLNGAVIRTLAPIELGILQDLGFRVAFASQSQTPAAA